MREINESDIEDRDTQLFFQIADIMDFKPERFNQGTWGEFAPDARAKQAWSDMYDGDSGRIEDVRWENIKECGTSMCVAGHAAALMGFHPIRHYNSITEEMVFDWSCVSTIPNQTHGIRIEEVAGELLGITEDESTTLFDGSMNWCGDDLRSFGKGETIVNESDRIIE